MCYSYGRTPELKRGSLGYISVADSMGLSLLGRPAIRQYLVSYILPPKKFNRKNLKFGLKFSV